MEEVGLGALYMVEGFRQPNSHDKVAPGCTRPTSTREKDGRPVVKGKSSVCTYILQVAEQIGDRLSLIICQGRFIDSISRAGPDGPETR